jgi:LysM repeat protein
VWEEVGVPERFKGDPVVAVPPFMAAPGRSVPEVTAVPKVELQNHAAPLKITVRAGDSFYRIISRYPGVKLEQLYAANKGSDRIYPGQILVIP